MATDASTSNFIALPAGVISKTGTCAQMADGNMADIKARRIGNLIEASLEDKRHANLWRTFREQCLCGLEVDTARSKSALKKSDLGQSFH
jgi:hypothetical protein